MSPVEQFDQQDFVERVAAELNVSASLISVKVTPIGERRRLAAERRKLNGTSTLSGQGLKLEVNVTIQVPQELKAGLDDPSPGSTLLAERAEKLRSLVNDKLVTGGTDLRAALGIEFTVSRSARVVKVEQATEVDCAPGYCRASHQTPHACMGARTSSTCMSPCVWQGVALANQLRV